MAAWYRLSEQTPLFSLVLFASAVEKLAGELAAALNERLSPEEADPQWIRDLSDAMLREHLAWETAEREELSALFARNEALLRAVALYRSARDGVQYAVRNRPGGEALRLALRRCPPPSLLRSPPAAVAAIAPLAEAADERPDLLARLGADGAALRRAAEELEAAAALHARRGRLREEASARRAGARAALVAHLRRLIEGMQLAAPEESRDPLRTLRAQYLPRVSSGKKRAGS